MPLRVETHHGLRNIQDTTATRVVVYDRFNNPLAVVMEVASGVAFADVLGSPTFEQTLQQLGVRHTTVLSQIQQLAIPEILP